MNIITATKEQEDLAWEMDFALHGPLLKCEYCACSKVLSPCNVCRLRRKGVAWHCRGCGYVCREYKRNECMGYEECKNLSLHNQAKA